MTLYEQACLLHERTATAYNRLCTKPLLKLTIASLYASRSVIVIVTQRHQAERERERERERGERLTTLLISEVMLYEQACLLHERTATAYNRLCTKPLLKLTIASLYTSRGVIVIVNQRHEAVYLLIGFLCFYRWQPYKGRFFFLPSDI